MGQGSLPGFGAGMGGRSVRSVLEQIAHEWAEDWFLKIRNEVAINLTGRVLGVVTANLRDSIGANSRVVSTAGADEGDPIIRFVV